MRDQIRELKNKIATVLLLAAATMLVSCATGQKENVAVANDPDAKPESMVPWNKPEKWETQGQLGNITDRR